jgi:FkbM family methyltransferase
MLTTVVYEQREFLFDVSDEKDLIQGVLLHGEVFDAAWLRDLSRFIPDRAIIVDVGANIGNHSVFFAGVCRAAQVIPFEPNPVAIDMLQRNLFLNGFDNIDSSFLGIGCASKPGVAAIKPANTQYNLGATAFQQVPFDDHGQTIPVDSLDNILPTKDVDLIKIDVEGMELEVLLGCENLVTRSKPLIYIEIWDYNPDLMPIFQWLIEHRYDIIRIRGPNLLCQHRMGTVELMIEDDAREQHEMKLTRVARAGFSAISMFFALQIGDRRTFESIFSACVDPNLPTDGLGLLIKLKCLYLECVNSPCLAFVGRDILIPALISDDLYRNELIELFRTRNEASLAHCLAIAGLDHSPEDAFCLHVKSMFFQNGGLICEALYCAEQAYKLSVTGRIALGVRLADMLRNTGGDLDRALSLTQAVPPGSPLRTWSDTVRAAILACKAGLSPSTH